MPTTTTYPFYVRFAFVLIIIIALGYLYTIGQQVISPLLLALLFAILMRPVAVFLNEKLRFPNALASLVTVVVFLLFFVVVFYFIATQVTNMADDWDKIKTNLDLNYNHLQSYVSEKLNLSKTEQNKMVKDVSSGSGKSFMSTTLLTFTEVLMSIIVIPIYMFLILLYRTHFAKFVCKLFNEKHHAKLSEIITTIKISVQGYIMGLLLEMVLVSVLTSVGLLIIGVKYAILLGVITGLLNLIPYLGIFIAGVLTVIASMTGNVDLSLLTGILVVNIVVQFVDNNILVPLVVSSKVEINPLASIVGIIVGGLIGGLSGMFLAIPIMAIIKVIFDRIDALEPWGYLLGDDLPKSFKWMKLRKVVKKAVDK